MQISALGWAGRDRLSLSGGIALHAPLLLPSFLPSFLSSTKPTARKVENLAGHFSSVAVASPTTAVFIIFPRRLAVRFIRPFL